MRKNRVPNKFADGKLIVIFLMSDAIGLTQFGLADDSSSGYIKDMAYLKDDNNTPSIDSKGPIGKQIILCTIPLNTQFIFILRLGGNVMYYGSDYNPFENTLWHPFTEDLTTWLFKVHADKSTGNVIVTNTEVYNNDGYYEIDSYKLQCYLS